MRAIAVVQALALVGVGLRGWPCAPPRPVCVCPSAGEFDTAPPDGGPTEMSTTVCQGDGYLRLNFSSCWNRYPYAGWLPDGGYSYGVARGPSYMCSMAEVSRGCQNRDDTLIGGPLAPPELPA